ncbi:hypothetical protein YC2023_045602 [Brassica napus]
MGKLHRSISLEQMGKLHRWLRWPENNNNTGTMDREWIEKNVRERICEARDEEKSKMVLVRRKKKEDKSQRKER